MSNKKEGDFIEINDIDSFKRALENAEIDYDELVAKDGSGSSIETINTQFDFDSNGDLLNIESIDRAQ